MQQGQANLTLSLCAFFPELRLTAMFAAPEVVQGHPYGYPVDVWATGCVLYLLLCGQLPFNSMKDWQTDPSAYSSYSVCQCVIVEYMLKLGKLYQSYMDECMCASVCL